MLAFFKKPVVVTILIAAAVVAGYALLKAKNPGGWFGWLP